MFTRKLGYLFHMPEYPLACWWDEWPDLRVPLGEAQMKYASKPVPEGAKYRNAPLLAAGIGILRVCHLLMETWDSTPLIKETFHAPLLLQTFLAHRNPLLPNIILRTNPHQ